MIEAAEVSRLVSSITNSRFEITTPGKYPLQRASVKWFIWCPEITEAREIPFLNVVWADAGNLYFDSLPIGNTVSWVEAAYGEEQAQESMNIDYADFAEACRILNQKFPLAGERISRYEKISSGISAKEGIQVGLFIHGRKGRATVRLRVQVPAPDSVDENVRREISHAVKTLKVAWAKIDAYERAIPN